MPFLSTIIELVTSLLGKWMSAPPKLSAEDQRDLELAQSVAHLVQPDDGDSFDEQDYWYDWQGIEPIDFWRRIFDIEAAGSESPDAQDRKAREHGLPGLRGYSRVKATFMRHFEHDTAFMQAMVTARQGEMQGWMDAAATKGAMLEPIDGVSVETWATIAATLTSMGDDPDGYHRLLAEHDLDAERYEAAQLAWTLRMQSADDPMGAAAVSQVYGQAFTAARSGGAFSAGANAASTTMGQAGQGPGGEAPCSLERYAEIMGAQSAWSKDGRDIHAMLDETFGMGAADFSDIGAWWSARMLSDYTLATQLHDLSEHYEAQYRTTSNADSDLVL